MLPKAEFVKIYKLDSLLLSLCYDSSMKIDRPKMSVFRTILSYSDIESKTVKIVDDMTLNHDDIVDIMLENQESDQEIFLYVRKIRKSWDLGKIRICKFYRKYRFALYHEAKVFAHPPVAEGPEVAFQACVH